MLKALAGMELCGYSIKSTKHSLSSVFHRRIYDGTRKCFI